MAFVLKELYKLSEIHTIKKVTPHKQHIVGRNPNPDMGFGSIKSEVNDSYT